MVRGWGGGLSAAACAWSMGVCMLGGGGGVERILQLRVSYISTMRMRMPSCVALVHAI